jgi:hypothetical protein
VGGDRQSAGLGGVRRDDQAVRAWDQPGGAAVGQQTGVPGGGLGVVAEHFDPGHDGVQRSLAMMKVSSCSTP